MKTKTSRRHGLRPHRGMPRVGREHYPGSRSALFASAVSSAAADPGAARTFYCDILLGRQVWPSAQTSNPGRLWFMVAGRVIETGPGMSRENGAIELPVEDPDEIAERTWDGGFTVLVHRYPFEAAELSIVDPFGRQIDLVRVTSGQAREVSR